MELDFVFNNKIKTLLLLIFFSQYYTLIAQDNNQLIPFRKGDKWGYVDEQKEIKIPLMYDNAEFFRQGIAVVGKDGKSGIINKNNKLLLAIKHVNASNYWCGNSFIEMEEKKVSYFSLRNRNESVTQLYMRQDLNPYRLINSDGKFTSPYAYQKVELFSEENTDFFRARRNDKYGILDRDGKEITPFIYDNISLSKAGVFVAWKNNFYGLINEQGEKITEFIYPNMKIFGGRMSFVSSTDKNAKEGMLNKDGSVRIPFKYQKLYHFSNGFAKAKIDDKFCLIDTLGQVVPNSESEEEFYFHRKFKVIAKDGKKGIANKSGEIIIPTEYDWIRAISGDLFEVKNNGKKGILNSSNELVIDTLYDYLYYRNLEKVIIAGKGGKYGLIDLEENILLPFDNVNNVGLSFIRNNFLKDTQEENAGVYYVKNGKLRRTNISKFHNYFDNLGANLLYASGSNEKNYGNGFYGLVDTLGYEVLPFDYGHLDLSKIDKKVIIADAKYGGKGLINLEGDTIIPFKYSYLHFIDDELILAANHGKNPIALFLDYSGKNIFNLTFDGAKRFREGIAPVKKNGKWGFITIDGKMITDYKYSYCNEFNNGFASVQIDGKRGFINKGGVEFFED